MRLKTLLISASVVRLLFIGVGQFQDTHGEVKYTDIDYTVVTDAARFVSEGKSPYERSTYRYSPLLSYLLLPNVLLHPLWGKLLFSAGDVLAGWLVAQIVRQQGGSSKAACWAAAAWLFNPWTFSISTRGSCDVLVVLLLLSTLRSLLQGHAFSAAVAFGLAVHMRIYPIIYVPSILLFLAARTALKHIHRTRAKVAARAGASSSTPPPPVEVTGQVLAKHTKKEDAVLHVLVHALFFGTVAGGLFLLLGYVFYQMYGDEFLQETFLHHLTRKDPRHNFSIYFYDIYLSHGSQHLDPSADPASSMSAAAGASVTSPTSNEPLSGTDLATASPAEVLGQLLTSLAWLEPLVQKLMKPEALAFVPQLVLGGFLSWQLHEELPLCWLLQTIGFVALNKVCTAQYFVWWLSLLPLVLPHVRWPPPRGLLAAAVIWAVAQLHWLGWAYLLEFKGQPVFLVVWAASLVFLAANILLLIQLMRHVRPRRSFLVCSIEASNAIRAVTQSLAERPPSGTVGDAGDPQRKKTE